jgi:hypothetical protein
VRSNIMYLSLLCFGLCACGPDGSGGGGGGGGGGGFNPPPQPVTRKLAQSQSATFSAGGYHGFAFTLPSAASFHFSASQTTTDTWNVGVFKPAQWVSYQTGSSNEAYDGVHSGVMQVSDTVSLPAGDWYLGFRCNNVFQRCMLVYNAEATY